MKLKNLLLTIPLALSLSAQEAMKIPKLEIEILDLKKVEFSDEARSELYDEYKDAKTEIPFCLYGSVDGRNIRINEVEIPLIKESSERSTEFNVIDYCDMERYIGMAHNHPRYSGCLMSHEKDRKRFILDRKARIELIVCGVNLTKQHMDMTAYGKSE